MIEKAKPKRTTAHTNADRPTKAIAPSLWLDDQGEEAAELYATIFPNSSVTAVARHPESFDNPSGKPRGSVMTVELELAGTPFTALNGGPHFTINPTISFFVHTQGVEEVERIATALVDGGSYLMELGEYPWSPRYTWVQDRFGVSRQVVPTAFSEMVEAGDDGGPGYERAFQAMLKMKKLGIAALQAAYEGAT